MTAYKLRLLVSLASNVSIHLFTCQPIIPHQSLLSASISPSVFHFMLKSP